MKRFERSLDSLSTNKLSSTLIRLVFLLTLLRAGVVSAQTFGGGGGGTITDPSGASVAGAAIVVEEVDTGLQWKLVSSGAGLYSAHSLPAGKYSVLVNASGFAVARREGVTVEERSERVVDVELPVGPSSQTMLVTSRARPSISLPHRFLP